MLHENNVYESDFFDLCAQMPDQSVDMVLCDLPYGTTAAKWDSVIPVVPMWESFRRIVKPGAAVVLTAAQPFTSALVMSKPRWFRHSWIWRKNRGVGFLNAKKRPMQAHEDVLVFAPKSPRYYPQMRPLAAPVKRKAAATASQLNNRIELRGIDGYYTERYPESVLDFASVPNSQRLHPTQKPVPLFRYLIRTYTQRGELVFDPCVGSGTTAVAAVQEGRRFIAGDQSAHYVGVACNRLISEQFSENT